MNIVPIFSSVRITSGKPRKVPKSEAAARLQQPQLVVIQGDLHPSNKRKSEASDMPVRNRANARAFLRRIILSLYVAQVGLTIQQMVTELDSKTESEDLDDFKRCCWLDDQLKWLGFHLGEMGVLVLAWPERLLGQYPHLQNLRPERYVYEDFS